MNRSVAMIKYRGRTNEMAIASQLHVLITGPRQPGNYGAAAWPFERTSLEEISTSKASFRLELGREELSVFSRMSISARDDARNKVQPYESLDFRLGLGQPQTSRIHRSMGTSCFMTLTIHGWDSISFGVGRKAGSTRRLNQVMLLGRRHEGGGEAAHVSLMKSFMASLQRTSASSSSCGG